MLTALLVSLLFVQLLKRFEPMFFQLLLSQSIFCCYLVLCTVEVLSLTEKTMKPCWTEENKCLTESLFSKQTDQSVNSIDHKM